MYSVCLLNNSNVAHSEGFRTEKEANYYAYRNSFNDIACVFQIDRKTPDSVFVTGTRYVPDFDFLVEPV